MELTWALGKKYIYYITWRLDRVPAQRDSSRPTDLCRSTGTRSNADIAKADKKRQKKNKSRYSIQKTILLFSLCLSVCVSVCVWWWTHDHCKNFTSNANSFLLSSQNIFYSIWFNRRVASVSKRSKHCNKK